MVRDAACAGYDADTLKAKGASGATPTGHHRCSGSNGGGTGGSLPTRQCFAERQPRRSAHIRQVPGICVLVVLLRLRSLSGNGGVHISRIESDAGKGRFLADTEATL